MKKKNNQKKRQRLRIHEVTAENDLRYRGPLNYQHFQILGWLCIVAKVTAMMLQGGTKLDPSVNEQLGGLISVLSVIGDFSLPFLLIANFAQILDDSDGYRHQLMKNVGAAGAIAALFYVFFYRYLVGGAAALLDPPEMARPMMEKQVSALAGNGFLTFNIFIDLMLCTLVMLFLNYKPKHIFRGKTVHLFRLFALLPIGYEVFCMYLKIRAAEGGPAVPVWMYPLLPVKPVMTFVLFILLALFVKTRELRFRRHGKTRAEYQTFLKTNRNSLNFSVFLAGMTVIICVIDLFLMMLFSIRLVQPAIVDMEAQSAAVTQTAAPAEPAAGDTVILPEAAPADAAATAKPGPEKAATPAELAQADAAATTEPGPAVSLTPEEAERIEQAETAAMERSIILSYAVGFGGSVEMIFLTPLMLLFSYTREPKNKAIGKMIPMAGIALIIIIFLEFIRYALFHLPISKIREEDLQAIKIILLGGP